MHARITSIEALSDRICHQTRSGVDDLPVVNPFQQPLSIGVGLPWRIYDAGKAALESGREEGPELSCRSIALERDRPRDLHGFPRRRLSAIATSLRRHPVRPSEDTPSAWRRRSIVQQKALGMLLKRDVSVFADV